MLTAPARPRSQAVADGPSPAGPVRVRVLHRGAAVVLAAALAGAVAGARVTGSGWLWLTALAVAAVAAVYLTLVVRLRHLAAEREMSEAFALDPSFNWDGFAQSLSEVALPAEAGGRESAVAVSTVDRALTRFVAAWVLGVLLTPFVVVFRLVGRTPGGHGRGVAGRLVRAQAYGRSQSLRMVAAGLVATAGVATAGVATAAVTVGGTAYALPAAVSAVGPPVTGLAGAGLDRTGAHAVVRWGERSARGGLGVGWTRAYLVGIIHLRASGAVGLADPVLTGLRTATFTSASRWSVTAGGREARREARAEKVALAQVGKPYAYGAAGPRSFDCSGLVMFAYAAVGVSLPHSALEQYDETQRITRKELRRGDLVFYDNYDGPQPGHVAMYIGDQRVVSANRPGTNVQTQSINWDGTIIGYGRVS